MKLRGILKEILDQTSQQSKYEDWEKGLIKAWGHTLYLSYHNIPNTIQNIVDENTTKKVFAEYFRDADEDEDLQDWMSDEPPTMNKGVAVFDRNRLSKMFAIIANKTKTTEPLTVYRYEDRDYEPGWNSYTTDSDISDPVSSERIKKSYTLPVGYPVVFASGLADQNEVILNLSNEDKAKFVSK